MVHYWYGLYNGSGNITVSLVQPNGSVLQEFGVPTVVDNLDTVTIALPAIDYNLTSYSGYKELTVSAPAIGNWQLKVRHSNVTKIETRVRWS